MDNQYGNDDLRRSAAAQFFLDENGPEGYKIREVSILKKITFLQTIISVLSSSRK